MRAATGFKILGAILIGLALIMVVGLVSLSHGPGRQLATALVSGRTINAIGRVSLSDLEGDILSDFRIGTLTLTDTEGVWLEAQEVHVTWRARSLLGSTVQIEAIEAASITVLRRPDLERDPSSGEDGGRGVSLNRLMIADLLLEEPVLGEHVALRAEASLTSTPNDGQTVSAEIVRTDGAADRLIAEFTRSALGEIEGRASAQTDANSPLAQLAYATGRGFTLDADISGDAQSGAADFVFTIGEQTGLQGQGRWQDGDWFLDAQTNAEAWPALPSSVRALLSGGSLSGQGEMDPRSGELRFSSEAGEIVAARSNSPEITVSGTLNSAGLALVIPEQITIGQARFDARFNPEGEEDWLTGQLQAEGVAHPQMRLEALQAQFVLTQDRQGYRFDVNGAGQGARWATARAGAVLGERIQFTAAGLYANSERRIRLDVAQLSSEGVELEAVGDISVSPFDAAGRFSLSLDDAGRVQAGLSGPVTLVGEGDADGLRISVQGDRLRGEGAPYALASGLTGQGRVAFEDGLALSDLDLEGQYARVSGGLSRSRSNGEWEGQLDYAVDVEGLQTGGLSGVVAGAITLDQREAGLSLRLQAQADTMTLGGTQLSDPVLRVEIDPNAQGGLAGDWRLNASVSDQTLDLSGALAWADGAGRVDVSSGRFADIAVEGEARVDDQAVSIDVNARQDGAVQLWSAALAYEAPRSEPLEGELDLSADLESYRLSGVTLSALNVRLTGPMQALTFELNADGAIAEPFTIAIGGPVSYQEGVRAELDFAGELSGRTLTSPQPLEIVYLDGALNAQTRLALDGAGLEFAIEHGPDGADLGYDLSNIPADLVMGLLSLPQAQGSLALTGQFQRQDALWTGRSALTVSGLSSASEPELGALDGEMRLEVDLERSRLSGAFSDDDLDIGMELSRTGSMSGVGALLEPDWRGDLRLNGDVSVLAALYMPEGEVLRGVLSVNAQIDGMDTSGSVGFREGALQSAIAGRTFEPISAEGSWRNGALVIETVQIGEGGKSGATAQAEFRATSEGLEGEGRIDLNQLYLVDRPELSGGASGYAEFTLQDRVLTLTGEADIQRMDIRPSGAGGGASIPQIEVEELNRPDVLDRAYRRPIRIDLDYRLRADDRLMVSSRAFSSEWSADVRVTGTANRPRLSGEANLLSGQASLLTAPFELTSGTVTFDGLVNQTRLAIEGRHEAPDLTVIGRVEGSVREPEVHFESTPSLPEDEILSRLLFGSGVSDLSPLQASQLAAQLSGAGWMDAMADVRAALGVDRLDVRQNGDGAITVLGGRQLTEDVYLELESGVGQALGSARIEWRLNPSLVLASEVSGDASNEISLSWRRSFD